VAIRRDRDSRAFLRLTVTRVSLSGGAEAKALERFGRWWRPFVMEEMRLSGFSRLANMRVSLGLSGGAEAKALERFGCEWRLLVMEEMRLSGFLRLTITRVSLSGGGEAKALERFGRE
jgi:hypothetical protein